MLKDALIYLTAAVIAVPLFKRLGLGAVLVLIGVILALIGGGLVCLLLGGISFLTGCIENVRAEVLYVRAKLEKN